MRTNPIFIALVVVLMFSCSKEEDGFPNGSGMLTFSLSADATGVNGGSTVTKATATPEEFDFGPYQNTDLYLIEILEGENEDVVESYENYGSMPEVTVLPAGKYKIRASYGELVAAAFGAPRFEGKTDFIIKENLSTKLDVVCAIANARLTVSYSDSLIMTYPTHSSEFSTDLVDGDALEFVHDETRSGWFLVSPEGTILNGLITVQDPLGAEQKFRVEIPSVKPNDHINLIFNSGPNEQSLTVKVTINEEVVDCFVEVFIPDYMLPVDAPSMATVGFAVGDPIVLALEDAVPAEIKVRVHAPGTIENCFLSIWEGNQEPVEYDLANLSETDVAELGKIGLSVPTKILREKRIELDFKPAVALLGRIPANTVETKTHNYKLVVKDSLINPNTSEPIILSIRMIPDVAPKIELSDEFASSLAVDIAEGGIYFKNGAKDYPDYTATIKTKPGIEPTEAILKVTNGGVVNTYDLISGTPALPDGITYSSKVVSYKAFIEALIVEPGGVNHQEYELTVKTEANGETYEAVSTLMVNIIPPTFVMQMRGDLNGNGDAFAKRAALHAYSQTGVTKKVKFQVQYDGVTWTDITNHPQVKGDMASTTVTNLNIETQYNVRAVYGNHTSEGITFTTEGEGTLPNSGFEKWYSEQTDRNGVTLMENLNYVYWNKFFPWDKNDASSKGWNTLNQKTTQDGGVPRIVFWIPQPPYVGCCYVANSGTIPTSDKRSGVSAALIRSVGWGSGSAGGNSAPKKTDSGLLYLGECNMTTFEPIYGIDFNTRPTALGFHYKYNPKSGDKFIVEVFVYDSDGNKIGTGGAIEGGSISTYTFKKYVIDYIESAGKAAKIHVLFKSGTNLNKNGDHFSYPGFTNLSDGEFIGSQLYVDDVELIYE